MDARGTDTGPGRSHATDPVGPGSAGDSLAAYRAKRSADRSPEPVGTVHSTTGQLFVVHKHAARQLHFDLRLEMDGVLRSWAVPRGPSLDQHDKRLAVRVEDHPLEYGDFEGIIPEGNYGAGAVIVWDRGEWVPLEDWRTGLEKGKLLFELKGYKLRGKWTLVKIKKSEKDWLLIKERDAWMTSPGDRFPQESVLSGLTVEEVKAGYSPARRIRTALEQMGAPRTPVSPRNVGLMLAESRQQAFSDADWLFELKLDGYRLLASKSPHEVLLLSRNGNDYTEVFPEVARAVAAIPIDRCVIDGEAVVLDAHGKPSFSRLQQRGRLTNAIDIAHSAVELPVTYFAFDLLGFEDFDLRSLPLVTRKKFLAEVLPALGPVRYLDHIAERGEAFLDEVTTLGLEGIIAKKADASYRAGRSALWLKIKTDRTGDFVIAGFTEPKGSRSGFGALQLADYVGGKLVYAGRAGTGFNDRQLTDIREALGAHVRTEPACLGPVASPGTEPLPADAIPETRTTTWVEPRLVCEVRFREWTPDGLLRHPAFLRMRPDKDPHQCDRQKWNTDREAPDTANVVPDETPDAQPPEPPERAVEKTVTLSNLRKVFWPVEGYTKGDLIEYYRTIAPWLLPYLVNRPVVLTRFPDGIEGKSFYQKDAPAFAPEWIRTTPIWSNDTQRNIRYFVCDNVESLTYIANMGTIPLHIWASRVGSLELPDWCVIDLDPKEAPFSDVVRCATVLHWICEDVGLPNYVKTTGKTGLHVLIPLARQCTYEQSRTFGELLARLVLRELPTIATITRHVTRRGDKVYLDYLQNRHGQLIVAPFSVRPLPGATVSMPLLWSEVNDALDPRAFTIATARARMDLLGHDPVRPVLDDKPDFALMLERIAALSRT
ncbi:MAG: Multifunctional non-homologous end joining protein LigD [Gemmatimonadaceae bacterium]|nr:Multifunctional non-homologous end joining protein LigD [Gemmatimonadaceae bacterium]